MNRRLLSTISARAVSTFRGVPKLKGLQSDRPVNDIELEPLRDPDVFRLVKHTVRRPQQIRRDSARGASGVLGFFDLIGGSLVGELRELWVIPGVVTHFMPLGDYPANQFRVSLDVLADQEEGGFEVTRFEQVEEPRRAPGVIAKQLLLDFTLAPFKGSRLRIVSADVVIDRFP